MLNNLPKEKIKFLLEHPRGIVKLYFKNADGSPLIITPNQERIVKALLFKRPDRLLIWATTRWGKSLAIALGAILAAALLPNEKIRIIAPTEQLAKVIMDYILLHILDHEDLTNSLTLSAARTEERLRQQLSKERITFRNGSEISILSAGIGTEGRSLLGRGGTIIIVDEAESIPPELIKTRIMRMAGETPDSMVVCISNPVYRGFMFEMRNNDKWHKIKIDWKTAVKEGRISQAFIDEMKANLTPQEFKVWYEAEYPEDMDNTLIKWEWIERATKAKVPDGEVTLRLVGVDLAAMGRDLTVLVDMEQIGDFFNIKNILSWGKTEMAESAGKIINYMEQNGITKANVDDTGIGGLASLLREHNDEWHVQGINFGAGAIRPNCMNMKAEIYYNLRKVFEDNKIRIPNHGTLKQQLNNLQMEFTSNGKIKINDGQSKSPDFADALALACYVRRHSELVLGRGLRILH